MTTKKTTPKESKPKQVSHGGGISKALEVQGKTDMERALSACEHITEGEGVRGACKREGMDQGKFFRLLAKEGSDELAKRYARARIARADARVESADEVIEALREGTIDAQTARVILDNIRWTAARENQARYGDKVEVEQKGEVTVKHKWGGS